MSQNSEVFFPKVQIFCFVNSICEVEGGELYNAIALSDEGEVLVKGAANSLYQAQEILAASTDVYWNAFPHGNFEVVWVDNPKVHTGVRRAHALNAARFGA
jgi:hypothetical protein